MKDLSLWLQWYYLIFLLPFGVAALFLLLSSVRIGHHAPRAAPRHGHAGGASARVHSHARASHANARHNATNHKAGHKSTGARAAGARSSTQAAWQSCLALLGIGRAPFSIQVQFFCLGWGFAGYWANQILLKSPEPTLPQLLPCFGLALGGGWLCARVFSEIFLRVVPQDESYDVSHEQLFGLTGRIVFPCDETTGRIRIYDEHGTLHDEPCRAAEGQLPLEKGCHAMVVDMDTRGRLIVESVPESVR